jgi:hypothetical protein
VPEQGQAILPVNVSLRVPVTVVGLPNEPLTCALGQNPPVVEKDPPEMGMFPVVSVEPVVPQPLADQSYLMRVTVVPDASTSI